MSKKYKRRKLKMKQYYKHLCACGCGEEVKPCNKFINGHNTRVNNPMKRPEVVAKFLGKNNSMSVLNINSVLRRKNQSERMLGKNNPMYGSKKQLGRKRPDMAGKNNPMHRLEVIEKFIGKNNPAWRGGTSSEPYCPIFSDQQWRQIIYDRDSNTCQNCGITKLMSYKVMNKNLCIHHINHIKKDCDLSNCILLCSSCNIKVEGKKLKKYYEEKFYSITKGD